MKKSILFFLLLFSGLVLMPAQSDDPFSGSCWQGTIKYTDTANRRRSDQYELILVKNGTGIVTVTTKDGRKEIFQDGDALWSINNGVFRLECEFYDAAIENIPYIDWKSVYNLENRNSFSLLVKPYPDAKSNIRVSFNRVDD